MSQACGGSGLHSSEAYRVFPAHQGGAAAVRTPEIRAAVRDFTLATFRRSSLPSSNNSKSRHEKRYTGLTKWALQRPSLTLLEKGAVSTALARGGSHERDLLQL